MRDTGITVQECPDQSRHNAIALPVMRAFKATKRGVLSGDFCDYELGNTATIPN